ncbi:MAG TPA: metalloregulator ArsR/SmtB family transcription factor [Candidatus Eremiobacteraceae bacterium]|nr:metalloregulator ArsR/SmtB family transcription factor [Candidatus Eremiobacteraceae bacterium]
MKRADLAGGARARQALESLHSRFFQGLADPTRLRIVRTLLEGPSTVGRLVARIGASQSGVSNHLACLKWCGYVTAQRSGRSVLYRISDPRVRSLVKTAESIVADNASRLASCTRISRG